MFAPEAGSLIKTNNIFKNAVPKVTLKTDATFQNRLFSPSSDVQMVGLRLVRTDNTPVDWTYVEKFLKYVDIVNTQIPFAVLHRDEQLFGTNPSSIDLMRYMNQQPIVMEHLWGAKLPYLYPTPLAVEMGMTQLEGYHVECDTEQMDPKFKQERYESFVFCPQVYTITNCIECVSISLPFNGDVNELWVTVLAQDKMVPHRITVRCNNKEYWTSKLKNFCLDDPTILRIPLIPHNEFKYPHWDGSAVPALPLSHLDHFEVIVDFGANFKPQTYKIEYRVNTFNSVRMSGGFIGYRHVEG